VKKLNILGIGRCIIGHLEKAINSDYSDQVIFDHHYLLNYETCLNSTFTKDQLNLMSEFTCSPSIKDQLLCLENLSSYDIIAIEVFPPALLYKKDNALLCFENFTNELDKFGFKRSRQNESSYNQDYILILENLVETITKEHPRLKVILVNGEINDIKNNIGSIRLCKLLENVKKSKILQAKSIKLLDMNKLIDNLSNQKHSTFEIAFPHVYLRHTSDLNLISIARDTKHATPQTRRLFLKYFCDIIQEFDFKAPQITIKTLKLNYFHEDFMVRAKNYLSLNNNNLLLEKLENSKTFSLYVSYAISIKDPYTFNNINNFLDNLLLLELSPKDLKYYFYHLRSLCVVGYIEQKSIISHLLILANKIALLPKIKLETCINFALLWIKNIYLVYSNQKDSSFFQILEVFVTNLNQNDYLLSFPEMRMILVNTKDLLSNTKT